jgi:DME family drug/metabolite transporter
VSARSGAPFILAAAVLWGTTGTAQALGPEGASPLAVGVLRILVGASALVAFALARKQGRAILSLPRKDAIVAGLAIAAYQIAFFAGVSMAGVAVGTLIAIGSSPIFIALVAWQRASRAWYVATAICLAGLVALAFDTGADGFDPLGASLALGAGLAYAIYAVACGRMAKADAPPDAMMAGVFALGALFLLPFAFIVPVGFALEPRGALMVLHLGVVALALAYALFARGLRMTPIASVGTLTLMEPLTATLLAVALLGETLSALAWAGAALLGAGLLTLARSLR